MLYTPVGCRYRTLGSASVGFALMRKLVPFVPGDHAFEGTSLAVLGGTFQHGQPDGDCDHLCLEAGVSHKTQTYSQPDTKHDHAVLTARRPPRLPVAVHRDDGSGLHVGIPAWSDFDGHFASLTHALA